MTIIFSTEAPHTCSVRGGKVHGSITASASDGWYLETSRKGDPRDDPTRFILEGSSDGDTWHTVSASSWVRDSFLQPEFSPRGAPYPMPVDRGALVAFDMRPHWAWVLCKAFVPWVDAVGMIVATKLAKRNTHHAKRAFAITFIFNAVSLELDPENTEARDQHSRLWSAPLE